MIELKSVGKIYKAKVGDIPALQHINLSVKKGEIYGVIGRSGAGKSTLIRCVNLLERPTTGEVVVNKQPLMQLDKKSLRNVRHQVGMIFQHFNLLSTRTVFENIAFPLEIMKVDRKTIAETVEPLLALTGLESRRDSYPAQLSGGQKQRVAIARALATKPSILLCDEMTSALDPETTESILKLVKEINVQLDLTILLITHEMDVIKKIADRVAVIEDGNIIEEASVVDLFKSPKTEIAKSFVNSVMRLQIPQELMSKMRKVSFDDADTVVQLSFVGEAAAHPVIDDLIRHYQVRVNILQANLEFLQHETFGNMLVALSGEHGHVENALEYLLKKNVKPEVIGYVVSDDLGAH